jgi:hypothetical protein
MENNNPDQSKETPKVHRQFSPYSGLYNPASSSGYPSYTDPHISAQSNPYSNIPSTSTPPITNTPKNYPSINPNITPTQSPPITAPLTTKDVLQTVHNLPVNQNFITHGRIINPLDELNLKTLEDRDKFLMDEQRLQHRFFRLCERSHNQILEEPFKTQFKRLNFYSSVSNFLIFFGWMGMYFTNTTEMKMSSRAKKGTVVFALLYLLNSQFFYIYKYNTTFRYFNQAYNGLRHSDIESKLNELRGDILEIR